MAEIVEEDSIEAILEDAYVASGSYCGCKQGEYLQPVESVHASNIKLQGISFLTCADNKVGTSVHNFGRCKLFGTCKLQDGESIKWKKYTNDVKIKGSNALNGMSCFKCPCASSEKINFYDHQQNKMENGQIKPKTTEDKVDEVIDGTKEKIIIRIF